METLGTPEEGKPVSRLEFNTVFGIVIGIAVVCALGFIGLLLTYFSQTQSAFNNLTNQVNQQTAKIDLLYQQCTDKSTKIEVKNIQP